MQKAVGPASPPTSRIDRRLVDTEPSSVGEVLLVSVVKKHKSIPAPSLPACAMKRIEQALGEHPPRLSPLPFWRFARAFAVVLAALISVEAVAVVGIRVVEVVRAQLAESGARHEARALAEADRRAKPVGGLAEMDAPPLPALAELPAPPPREAPVPAVAAPRVATVGPMATSTGAAHTFGGFLPPPVVLSSRPLPTSFSSPEALAITGARPASSTAPPPAPVSPAIAAPDGLDLEAAQLKQGLELKHAGRLASAITALEDYRKAYPGGAFWIEATIAELDAQLSLGQRDDALSLLEQAGDSPALPRSAELRLLRAELSARRGRCGEALAEFESALQIPSLAERALYGRAACQEALGRFQESRSSFEAYLTRYPDGALATEVRRALGLTR